MIPVSLTLKNFMCYKGNVPTLSFEGIHIACLCGDNGNGKSAIFDALTWVLWGQSRANSDDDLIHFGQTDMRVELEFLLKDQKYRALRTRNKKMTLARSGQSTLDLFIYDEHQGYKSISGNTMTETQKKIIDLLHMDYQTFINSAFLRQGHSNDFSIKRPAERKEILVNILGLDIYDDLVSSAREEIIKQNNLITSTTKQIEDMTYMLVSKDACFSETSKLTEQKNEIEIKKKNAETKIIQIREKRALLELKREKSSHLNLRIHEIKKELSTWKIKIEDSSKKLDSYNEILNDSTIIELKYLEFLNLKRQFDDYNTKLSEVINLQNRIRQIEEKVNKTTQGLLIEYEKSNELLKITKDTSGKLHALITEHARIDEELNLLSIQENDLQIKRKLYDDLVKSSSDIKANLLQFDLQLKDDLEKVRLLESGDATCPLCGQALTELDRGELKARFLHTIDEVKQKKQDSSFELASNAREKLNLSKTIQTLEKNIRLMRDELNKQNAVLSNRIVEAQEAAEILPEISEKTVALAGVLSTKNYALDDQKELQELLNAMENIKYDTAEHQSIKTKLAAIQRYEGIKQKLSEAINMAANEQRILDEAKQIITSLEDLMKSNYEQLELLSFEIKELEEATQYLESQESYLQSLTNEEKSILTQIAVNHERIRKLTEIEENKRKMESEISVAQFELNIYRDLMDAFSKKGIQALLISQAFPEIEIEANRLLGKMSDNRLSLKLESQKESKSKKGEPIETLDIKISDELGTRDYEMFSGGESFRIDLALRIALSKLLVRRAGASLPVLIIDEGFGTQDNTGRERLIEAIKSIEDDFEKIFVITHLEDLKDSFPVTINVTKSAEGSSIEIS